MSENDSKLPSTTSGAVDLFGLGKAAQWLIGPLERGIGRIFKPLNLRRENDAQIANVHNWHEAMNTLGYEPRSMELTIGEQASVRVLADNIGRQENRRNIAAHAIEQAQIETMDGEETSLLPPDIDWVDRYWRLAENVTNEDMQSFWGKVLARRCLGKAPFSPRALDFLSTLVAEEALALEELSKTCFRLEHATTSPNRQLTVLLDFVDGEADGPIQAPEIIAHRKRISPYFKAANSGLFGPLGIFYESGVVSGLVVWPERDGYTFYIADQKLTWKSIERKRIYFGACEMLTPLGVELFGMLNSTADQRFVDLVIQGLAHRNIHAVRV